MERKPRRTRKELSATGLSASFRVFRTVPRQSCSVSSAAPVALVPHLPHEPLRAVHRRKEQAIAHHVERTAQNTKSFGRGRVERREPVLLGEPVIRRKLKASAAHLLVVLEIRTSAAPVALLDEIRKEPAQPQR